MLVDVKMDLDEIDMSTEDDDRLNDNSGENEIHNKEMLLDDTVNSRKVLNEAKDDIKGNGKLLNFIFKKTY